MNVEFRPTELELGEKVFGHGRRITSGFGDLACGAEETCRDAQGGAVKMHGEAKYLRERC